jgi:hypothetical protein
VKGNFAKARSRDLCRYGGVSACVFLFGNLPASRLRLRGISWSLGRPSCGMQEGRVTVQPDVFRYFGQLCLARRGRLRRSKKQF